MSHEIPWIRETLLASYPQLDQDGGIDLDNSGTVEENEIVDTNHSHRVSEEEAYRFYVDNGSILNSRIDFLRWGSGLSSDNPIHQLIYLESKLAPPAEIQAAYEFITAIVKEVGESLNSIPESEEISPLRRMARVYLVLQGHNVSFDSQLGISDDSLFTDDIAHGEMDCDTATFVLLTAAHEFDWPVYAISAPRHLAARWDEGDGEYIDFDTRNGQTSNDYRYMNQFHISREQVERGIFLKNLTPAELSGYFYMNRGSTYALTGRLEEAVADLSRAIELDPRNPIAYHNRAIARERLGYLEEALADFNRTIELWPDDSSNYFRRAGVKIKLGQFEEAIEDLDRSLELKPQNAFALFLRGIAKVELGNSEAAESDFERATIEWPRLGEINYQAGDDINRILDEVLGMSSSESMALYSRAMAKVRTADLEGALADLNRIIEIDPQDEPAYNARGTVRSRLGQYEEAMADFNRALELFPRDARTFYNIAILKIELGDYQEALRNVGRALEIDPTDELARSLENRLRALVDQNN